jgi:type IV pilus assembly protein PilM
MEVLLVAAKKDMVTDYAELIRDAGLKPTVIDVDSFAVQNSYEENYSTSEENPDEVIGLLNIGSDVTNINIIQNKNPHFTRDISIGTNNFIEKLQKDLGLDYEGAQQVIKGDLSEVNEAEIKEIFRKKAADLSLGIERSISFLKAAGDADKIDKIILSGGGARLPFLKEILSEKHDIDFQIHDPLAHVKYEDGVFAEYEEELDAIAPLLTVGIGLALRKAGE